MKILVTSAGITNKRIEYLHRSLGERFRPCPLLVEYVKAGRLGRKVVMGVYEYGEAGE